MKKKIHGPGSFLFLCLPRFLSVVNVESKHKTRGSIVICSREFGNRNCKLQILLLKNRRSERRLMLRSCAVNSRPRRTTPPSMLIMPGRGVSDMVNINDVREDMAWVEIDEVHESA
jgi:hypothetical protein